MQIPPLAMNAWLRYDVVSRLLPLDARTILEIGCGGGAFGYRLAAEHDYLGVEPDGRSYTAARDRLAALRRAEVRHGMTGDVLEAGRQFDLVCAFEVLEHLEDDEAAVREWLNLVSPGGHLLLSVPAFQERFGPWDVHAGHYRRYSPEHLTDLLHHTGLTEIEVVAYGAPLGYALERARNAYLRLNPAAGVTAAHFSPAVTAPTEEMADRTAQSGRLLQPLSWMAPLTRLGTAPFRRLQRRFPTRGTGLVARARTARTA